MDKLIDCIEYSDKRKILTCRENGIEYRITNDLETRICKVKIDGCLDQGKGEKRCDYLFFTEELEVNKAIFVELKGTRLKDAINQIIDSINYLREEFIGHTKYARIIGKGDVPRFVNFPEYKRLHGLVYGNIKRSTNKILEESI